MDSIEITRPDDWHVHLRDGDLLARVLPYTAGRFGRAVVMPNLDPPVIRVEDALRYRARILSLLPEDSAFEPLMTLYLSDETTAAEIEAAARSSRIVALKFYPQGATTHSARGLRDLADHHRLLEAIERSGLPLLVHGETTAPDCDVFDRERRFLEETLAPLVGDFQGLRVVFEHITTAEAAAFVSEAASRVAATITPQHLLLNRNALFEGGFRPHHYCVPVLKRERDRRALVSVATSGDPSFFLGTDSAPHPRGAKQSACGCAGIFNAPIAIEAYAEAFRRAGAMDRLEAFASHHGPAFYGLPRNADRIRLERRDGPGPTRDGDGAESLEIFWAGEKLTYHVADPCRK
ncbi:MAG TPA: dihydroorotase [Deltaproteobacteria bacterium]|nr:dihydroorotase [Deltaproteobacteria bacterium]